MPGGTDHLPVTARRAIVAHALILVVAAPAAADAAVAAPAPAEAAPGAPSTFAEAAGGAEQVKDLGETLRPYLEKCVDEEAWRRRQCDLLRDRLMFLGSRRTFRAVVPQGAARVESDARGRTAIVLDGCLACDRSLALPEGVAGGGFVTGKTPARAAPHADDPSRTRLFGIEVARTPADGVSDARELRAEVVFRPLYQGAWTVPRRGPGGVPAEGAAVELVAWRVWDRCTGRVWISSPATAEALAAAQETDPTCPGYVAPEPVVELPRTLSQDQIARRLKAISEDILICYDRYGEAGHAPTRLVVTGSTGRISSLDVRGRFAGSPTAECIEKVVRQVAFPRFSDPDLTVEWPFYLR